MTIASEIQRILAAKSAIREAIEAKLGSSMPEGTKLDGFAAYIAQIETGGGGQASSSSSEVPSSSSSASAADQTVLVTTTAYYGTTYYLLTKTSITCNGNAVWSGPSGNSGYVMYLHVVYSSEDEGYTWCVRQYSSGSEPSQSVEKTKWCDCWMTGNYTLQTIPSDPTGGTWTSKEGSATVQYATAPQHPSTVTVSGQEGASSYSGAYTQALQDGSPMTLNNAPVYYSSTANKYLYVTKTDGNLYWVFTSSYQGNLEYLDWAGAFHTTSPVQTVTDLTGYWSGDYGMVDYTINITSGESGGGESSGSSESSGGASGGDTLTIASGESSWATGTYTLNTSTSQYESQGGNVVYHSGNYWMIKQSGAMEPQYRLYDTTNTASAMSGVHDWESVYDGSYMEFSITLSSSGGASSSSESSSGGGMSGYITISGSAASSANVAASDYADTGSTSNGLPVYYSSTAGKYLFVLYMNETPSAYYWVIYNNAPSGDASMTPPPGPTDVYSAVSDEIDMTASYKGPANHTWIVAWTQVSGSDFQVTDPNSGGGGQSSSSSSSSSGGSPSSYPETVYVLGTSANSAGASSGGYSTYTLYDQQPTFNDAPVYYCSETNKYLFRSGGMENDEPGTYWSYDWIFKSSISNNGMDPEMVYGGGGAWGTVGSGNPDAATDPTQANWMVVDTEMWTPKNATASEITVTTIQPSVQSSSSGGGGSLCFVKGTMITLADGTEKPVEDVGYDDELLVWNFDDGRYDTAKPAWIQVEMEDESYLLSRYSNGAELKTVGPEGMHHEAFDTDMQMFDYVDNLAGHRVRTLEDGDVECLSCEIVEEHVKHYNIITERHFNLYANGILTSCRLSKMYPVSDMVYIKPAEPRNTPSELPAETVSLFRLDEQPYTMDDYVMNFLSIGRERNPA